MKRTQLPVLLMLALFLGSCAPIDFEYADGTRRALLRLARPLGVHQLLGGVVRAVPVRNSAAERAEQGELAASDVRRDRGQLRRRRWRGVACADAANGHRISRDDDKIRASVLATRCPSCCRRRS